MEKAKIQQAIGTFLSWFFLMMAAFFPWPASAVDFRSLPPDKIYFPPLTFDLVEPQRLVLDNGLVIYFLEDHELPLINIRALVKTGTIYDPVGKEGVAELTAAVMRTGGTKSAKSDEVDGFLDFLAAHAAISMSRDSCQINFSIAKNDFGEGLEILSQILMQPAFEPQKYDLAVELKKEDLRRLKDNPQRLAFREFNRLIYQGDPWGRFSTQTSIANIVREDLISFHSRFFRPDNIIFAVSGDVSRVQLIEKFRLSFGAWQKGEKIEPVPMPHLKTAPGVYCLHKDMPQSIIITGQFAPGKNDSTDYFASTLLDFVTGSGGFASKIVGAVRSSRGLAYSAGSYYRARPDFGVLGAYAFTKTVSTMKTMGLIHTVLDEVRRGAVTEEELAWAKRSINNGFIFSFTTPDSILWQQINNEYDRLPADFLVSYCNKISSVNIIDINRMAAKYLDKKNNVVLILGDCGNLDESEDKTTRPVLITLPD
ncbi:MAG: insulinase family protein [Deltaproteobacteria bacterium]|nr:insulinase family protein [Deltaproteobacteria bacterium]